ncbi:TetR/AcrR family transcriptional regulator [Paenibacillus sp. J5C_2022]|uniref:TetR/AcrR family transcriptional regulator n=1 Tax=Paenibacillus sp. J5C2022 TaxID=2977129 RepID=UPI0021D0DCF3|nr:TetR/AcrR family transcriptional regulator [Paenibacillus sp. J5C2022]MCU6707769.1 TetR/AcrR family transcriptional regulator [Paenibacillus sp. J5C2022]
MSKNKIIDAAIKLFSKLGYHRTSMDDIAAEANVAKGTLYYHFSGKGELFETIVTNGISMLQSEVQNVLREDQSAEQQVRLIVQKHIELFLRYNELIHIISNELTNGIEPDILERLGKLKADYITFLSGILLMGYEDGVLNKFNSEWIAAGLLGLIETSCLFYIRQPGSHSVEELHDTINAFVLPALLKKNG